MNLYMPGDFRTRAQFEKWDMAFDSKMPCLVLKSLDRHEMGRQAWVVPPLRFYRRPEKSANEGKQILTKGGHQILTKGGQHILNNTKGSLEFAPNELPGALVVLCERGALSTHHQRIFGICAPMHSRDLS